MRYAFIEQHRSVWPIEVQCRVLQASRHGYYAWRAGAVGKRKVEDAVLMPFIREVHTTTGHTYGAEWIAKDVRKVVVLARSAYDD